MTRRAANLRVWAALLAAVIAAMVALAVGSEPAKAAFPGSNGAIAFDDRSQVFRMNSDGFGKTKHSDATGSNFQPDWSADGKKIAFVNSSNNNHEVYWMNSDGSGEINLTKRPALDIEPAFFPDHHKIAFTSTLVDVGGNFDIFKMTVDDRGTIIAGPIRLTTSTANDSQPAVSPDGKMIAFVSNRSGNPDIFKMKADGSGVVDLTKSAAFEGSPSWQPDP